jgi:hypothetical protein
MHDGAVLALGSRLSLASCASDAPTVAVAPRHPGSNRRLDYLFTGTMLTDVVRSCETLSQPTARTISGVDDGAI